MSPTYTMSAHLCKQFYASWRQTRPAAGGSSSSSTQDTALLRTRSRSPLAEGKRSMDSDRSDGSARRDSSASAR
ncbi:hypothetical protein J3459_003807 [Metarhizium acridum]|nr:hypothetical protein J3459_003807 [Metarhizium acridum]